jgi:hypothetical protein
MENNFKSAAPVTPSDTANIPNPSAQDGIGNNGCYLYIGVALANIKVKLKNDQEVTIKNPAVGRVLPLEVVRVFVTGSVAIAANDIIALWR